MRSIGIYEGKSNYPPEILLGFCLALLRSSTSQPPCGFAPLRMTRAGFCFIEDVIYSKLDPHLAKIRLFRPQE